MFWAKQPNKIGNLLINLFLHLSILKLFNHLVQWVRWFKTEKSCNWVRLSIYWLCWTLKVDTVSDFESLIESEVMAVRAEEVKKRSQQAEHLGEKETTRSEQQPHEAVRLTEGHCSTQALATEEELEWLSSMVSLQTALLQVENMTKSKKNILPILSYFSPCKISESQVFEHLYF